MDKTHASALAEMGISLTALAVKGTATAINSKIKSIKDEKNLEKVRNTYDEIINELLSEREEAVRIAQAYKTELDKIVISDEDIQHLHNTVSRVLEIIKSFQLLSAIPKGAEEVQKVIVQIRSYEQLKELISVDTLKTMQLLGFNYKTAIAITALGEKKNSIPKGM
mgnify:CR=1 FL=1